MKRKSSPSTLFLSSFFFLKLLLSSRHCHLHTSNPKLLWNRWWITKWVTFFSFTWRVLCSSFIRVEVSNFFRPVHQKCHCPSCVRRIIPKFGWLYYTPDHLQPFHPLSIPNWNSVGIVPLSRSSNRLLLVGPVVIHRVGKSRSLLLNSIQQSVMDEWRWNILTSHSFRRNSHKTLERENINKAVIMWWRLFFVSSVSCARVWFMSSY